MAEVKQWWKWMEEARSLDGLKMVDGEQVSSRDTECTRPERRTAIVKDQRRDRRPGVSEGSGRKQRYGNGRAEAES
ncbi:hypothetical protein PAMA_008976 [Pampus argenteus]